MRAEDIKDILTEKPFTPIRIYMSDGHTYDVSHPDQVMVLKSRLVIGVESDPRGIFDRTDQAAIIHIVRVEQLQHA